MDFQTIFTKEIEFDGKHGAYLDKLKSERFFDSYVEIYSIAALVGLMRNKTAKRESSVIKGKSIFLDTLSKHREKIMTAFHLVMLLDNSSELSDKGKINRALDIYPDKTEEEISEIRKNSLEIFNSYARGGIEILYDIMIEQVEREKYDTEDSEIQAISNLAHEFIPYSQKYKNASPDKVLEYDEIYDIVYK